MQASYSIAKAAQLSGLTTHLIRAWENRYSVVVPARNDGGQRRYSDDDIERLRSLSRLVETGYRIGDIANLPGATIAELMLTEPSAIYQEFIGSAFAAARAFDAPSLEAVLNNAAEELGAVTVSDQVIFPFMEELGRSWNENQTRTMNEHLASTVVHALYARLFSSFQSHIDAPAIVIATPPNQEHNLGAAACAVAVAEAGYRVCHLGTHIPAEEVLAAVLDIGAATVLLSVVFPPHTALVKEAFDILERELPRSVVFAAGGVSAGTFMSAGSGRVVKAPRKLSDLQDFLAGFRR